MKGKSIIDHMRNAIELSLTIDDAITHVMRRISTKRVSKKRIKEMYQHLLVQNGKEAGKGT